MKPERNQFIAGICVLLALVTLICYWPITRHNFTTFDDPEYITENPHVAKGLTWSGVVWAFRSGYACNWHPLSWLSHMADCELYGLNPGGHHLTNLFFHIANSLLLFLLLKTMTGKVWRSAFVAALFAWHPLHVESVAWAAERKDVLSTLFWMLTILAYTKYVGRRGESKIQSLTTEVGEQSQAAILAPKVETHPRLQMQEPARGHSMFDLRFWYCLSIIFFACGLMSKPMLVTLPFVLLLLDYWPLGRFQSSTFQRLVREKLPFFALTLASSIITFCVQHKGGAVSSLSLIPFHTRVANALVSYLRYIIKTIWPTDLAAVYPYPHWPMGLVLSAAVFLVVCSIWCILRAKQNPYLATGWLWYLGTLVPTIGLIQVGAQSIADRYMYIPSIGLFMLLVWTLSDYLPSWLEKRKVLTWAGATALVACLVVTSLQLRYWHDSEKLFRHALQVTTDNYIAYDCLGKAMDDAGRKEEALLLYSQAIRINSKDPEGQYNVGTLLMQQDKLPEAVTHFRAALGAKPKYAHAQNNLGCALLRMGKLSEARANLATAVTLAPDDPETHYNLGTVLLAESRLDGAIIELSKALELRPDYLEAHGNLGAALMGQGKFQEGAAHFAELLRLKPDDPEAYFNFGLALLEQNRAAEAAKQFSEGLRLRPNEARFHCYLAMAFDRQHDSKAAIAQYREALRLSPDFPDALNGLAWILSSDPRPEVRAGEEAAALAKRACELTDYKRPDILLTLAAAYAEAHRLSEAVATAQKALELALAARDERAAAKARELLKTYQSS